MGSGFKSVRDVRNIGNILFGKNLKARETGSKREDVKK
jgi:hypothetical protein